MQISAAGRVRFEISGAFKCQRRLVRGAEIARAADQPGDVLRQHVEHLAGCLAPGDALGVGGEDRQLVVPAVRQLAPLHLADLRRQPRVSGTIGGETFCPDAMCIPAARADALIEAPAHRLGHEEFCLFRPAVKPFGQPDLFLAERLAMRGRGVLLVRSAVADMAVEDDEGGAALGGTEFIQRLLDTADVIGVGDMQDVPAIGAEARADILAESEVGAALDGDVIVVVDPAEIVQAEMTGEGCRFRADALHHVAVAADRIDAVVENLEARPVIAGAQPFARDRHPQAHGDALSERAGGGLDARRQMIFGMAGCPAVELAEALDIVERNGGSVGRLALGVQRLRARSDRAPTIAASRHGRSTAGSGRGSARRGRADRSASPGSIAYRRAGPAPSACPDDPTWPPARHPSTGCGWY